MLQLVPRRCVPVGVEAEQGDAFGRGAGQRVFDGTGDKVRAIELPVGQLDIGSHLIDAAGEPRVPPERIAPTRPQRSCRCR